MTTVGATSGGRMTPVRRAAIFSVWVCIAALCALSGAGVGTALNAVGQAVN